VRTQRGPATAHPVPICSQQVRIGRQADDGHIEPW
jgi:hypothetical protein